MTQEFTIQNNTIQIENRESCLLASTSRDVKFHSFPSGRLAHVYKCSTTRWETGIRTISWSKDGSWLVLVPQKGLAEVVTLKDHLRYLHTIHDVQQPTCASFQNLSKKIVAVGNLNGQVLLYDMKSKSTRKRLPRACGPITDIHFTANDANLVAACETGEVLLYNCVTSALSASYTIEDESSDRKNGNAVTSLTTHPLKKNLFAGGAQNGVVSIWDSSTHSNPVKMTLKCHSSAVSGLSFRPSSENDLLVSVSADGNCCFLDANSGSVVLEFKAWNPLSTVDFGQDGVSLAIGGYDGTIRLFDVRFMKTTRMTIEAHTSTVKNVSFQKGVYDHSTTELNEPNVNVVYAGDSSQSPVIQIKNSSLKDSEEIAKACDVKSFLANLGLDKHELGIKIPHESIQNQGCKKIHGQSLIDVRQMKSDTQLNSQSPKTATSDSTVVEVVSARNHQTTNKGVQINNNQERKEPQNLDEIRGLLKQEVREEFQKVKTELRCELMEIYAYIRRQFMDMHLAMVKEFVQLDEFLNRLRDDLTVEEGSEDEVIFQENLKLRREVAVLTEKLKKEKVES